MFVSLFFKKVDFIYDNFIMFTGFIANFNDYFVPFYVNHLLIFKK